MSAILLCAIAVYGPQLTFVDGAFNVTDGDKTETVALNAGAASAPLVGDNISMQVGDVLVTFDERGLGIQYGKQGGFTTLSYMPTTPKLFSAEEIKANADAITSGERSARVSAVSGFVVVKDTLYMLMRWEDKDGKPWLLRFFERCGPQGGTRRQTRRHFIRERDRERPVARGRRVRVRRHANRRLAVGRVVRHGHRQDGSQDGRPRSGHFEAVRQ